VEFQFHWTGRFPRSLYDEIARQKVDIYNTLSRDPQRQDMLSGSRVITVDGRSFDLLFAIDPQQIDRENDIRPLRVINIDEKA
jgi:hypothetical protein